MSRFEGREGSRPASASATRALPSAMPARVESGVFRDGTEANLSGTTGGGSASPSKRSLARPASSPGLRTARGRCLVTSQFLLVLVQPHTRETKSGWGSGSACHCECVRMCLDVSEIVMHWFCALVCTLQGMGPHSRLSTCTRSPPAPSCPLPTRPPSHHTPPTGPTCGTASGTSPPPATAATTVASKGTVCHPLASPRGSTWWSDARHRPRRIL